MIDHCDNNPMLTVTHGPKVIDSGMEKKDIKLTVLVYLLAVS